MPGDSKCQTEILDVYSDLEMANEAGRAAFKSIWKENAKAGAARKIMFVRDDIGKDYVALMKVPGRGDPDRVEIRVEERKVLSKTPHTDLRSEGGMSIENGRQNIGNAIVDIGMCRDNGTQTSDVSGGTAQAPAAALQILPANSLNTTKRRNEEDGTATQSYAQKRQKVDETIRNTSPVPPCPHWITVELSRLRRRFPNDRFDCVMDREYYTDQVRRYGLVARDPLPSAGFTPKIVCFDCPEKKHGVGCTPSLWSFETHHLSKNALHRERVEARVLRETPIEKLRKKAARLQQAMDDRSGF